MEMIYAIAALNIIAFSGLAHILLQRKIIQWTLPSARHKYVLPKIKISTHKNTGQRWSKNFYRIYKYMYVQSTAGTRTEDIFKSLHKVVSSKSLKREMLQFSSIMAQSYDLKKALDYLRGQLSFEDGKIFIDIMENVATTGLPPEAFSRLDGMLFQKYLSYLRHQTTRIKRLYLVIVILFTAITSAMLLFPLIHQTLESADMIFS